MQATRAEFPRSTRVLEHAWIPMSDGCRLAATIWLPEDADSDPVPALLEYIPYRKNDGTAVGDSTRHPYFAGHGYASVRVDIRGSGDSDGVLRDEYLPQEQDDAVEVLAWLAAQPWCTGKTGMFGISWGGFNSLQVAARRPPSLQAIITLCSTDDRYADDVHYMGGCLLGVEALSWAATMLAFNARPPDPAVVGERWRDIWLERLEGSPPFIEEWVIHQRRDAYWKQGSVCEDYGAIECAVYAVGGWADPYRNAIFRLLAGLPGPRKALIGPWSHCYPEAGVPGPAIGFLQEALRWWDHWLKGIDTGIMDEPMVRAWMQGPVKPAPYFAERPGRWVAEPTWPSPTVEPQVVELTFPAADVRGVEHHGLLAGDWCPYGGPEELPPDQRVEDGLCLCFDTEPFAETLELLGFPEVELTLSADQPQALVCARLCDIAPDGSSLLVTRGLLNLTHRDSHEHPSPLVPGQHYTITLRLNSIAHAFPPGHRLRIALSPTYWPWAWPSPKPATLTIHTAHLHLPTRPPQPHDDQLPPFQPPEAAEPLDSEIVRTKESGCEIHHEVVAGRHELTFRQDYGGRRRLEDGLEFETYGEDVFTILEGDPLSAVTRSDRTDALSRGDWHVRVDTSSVLSGNAESFLVTNVVEGFEGDVRVFAKTWNLEIPREDG